MQGCSAPIRQLRTTQPQGLQIYGQCGVGGALAAATTRLSIKAKYFMTTKPKGGKWPVCYRILYSASQERKK
jgi:hypothetical protein